MRVCVHVCVGESERDRLVAWTQAICFYTLLCKCSNQTTFKKKNGTSNWDYQTNILTKIWIQCLAYVLAFCVILQLISVRHILVFIDSFVRGHSYGRGVSLYALSCIMSKFAISERTVQLFSCPRTKQHYVTWKCEGNERLLFDLWVTSSFDSFEQ